jgi:guanyl-specific ribonuclease Sa
MRHMRWLMLAFLAVMVLMAWIKAAPGDVATPAVASTPATPPVPTTSSALPPASANTQDLPPEVDATLARIAAGGPFPYERDGLVFGNFEGRLPARERGWYHEYTVPTPGVGHRGARRIVTGGEPASEFWYTDDHYETFRAIEGGK